MGTYRLHTLAAVVAIGWVALAPTAIAQITAAGGVTDCITAAPDPAPCLDGNHDVSVGSFVVGTGAGVPGSLSASLSLGGGLTFGPGIGQFNQAEDNLALPGGPVLSAQSGKGTYTLGGSGNLTIPGNLILTAAAGSSGTFLYKMLLGDAATLNVNGLTFGPGNASFSQRGGTLPLGGGLVLDGEAGSSGTDNLGGTSSLTVQGDIILGADANSTGTSNYDCGSDCGAGGLAITNRSLVVGDAGTGSFAHTGGTNAVTGDLVLGNQSTGQSVYDLEGDGHLAVQGNLVLGAAAGLSGFFKMNTYVDVFDNATLTVGSTLIVGDAGFGLFHHGGDGTYALSSGTLQAKSETIGNAGTGVFNQTGGTNTVAGALTLAGQSGDTDGYNLSSGTLAAGSIAINLGSSFNQTGGSAVASGNVGNSGRVTINGANVAMAVGGTYRHATGRRHDAAPERRRTRFRRRACQRRHLRRKRDRHRPIDRIGRNGEGRGVT